MKSTKLNHSIASPETVIRHLPGKSIPSSTTTSLSQSPVSTSEEEGEEKNDFTKISNILNEEQKLQESPTHLRSICTSPLPINVIEDPESLITKDVVKLFQYSLNKFLGSLRAMNLEPPADIKREVIKSVDKPMDSTNSSPKLPNLINDTYGQNVNIYVKVAKYIRETLPPKPLNDDLQQVNLTPQEILVFAAMGTDTTNISNLRELLDESNNHHLKPLNENYPIINKLTNQLIQIQSSIDESTFTTLNESIKVISNSINLAIKLQNPVPLFKKIWFSDDKFYKLLKKRQYFSLRVLFVFLCLCMMTRLPFMNEINVWVDYIEWFMNFSLAIDEGDLLINKQFRKFDECLYNWVLCKKIRLDKSNLDKLGQFDPESNNL